MPTQGQLGRFLIHLDALCNPHWVCFPLFFFSQGPQGPALTSLSQAPPSSYQGQIK